MHSRSAYCIFAVVTASMLLSACGGSGDSAPPSYTVTTTTSVGGNISPSNTTITAGQRATFTLTANEGYQLNSATGCGGTLSGNTYVTGPINAACSVSASFDKIIFNVRQFIQRNNKVETTLYEVEYGQPLTVPVAELTWYAALLNSNCEGRLEDSHYIITAVTQSCDITLNYQLSYLPADIQPAVGFSRGYYELTSGESTSVQLLAQSFTSEHLTYHIQQLSGPTIAFSRVGDYLELTAPTVDDISEVTLSVSVIDEHGAQASNTLELRIYPAYSEQVSLLTGTNDGVGIDLVLTGDGFTAEQQGKLAEEAAQFVAKFFNEPTVAVHRDFWNIHFAPAISAEAGAINGIGGQTSLDTVFNSYFNCSNIERLLCVNISKLLSFTWQRVPQYEQILVIVNDLKYGGAGYWGAGVATFSMAPTAKEIAIHELGHSFANLADEYEYGDCSNDVEFSPVNITIESVPARAKWKYWYTDPNNIATDAAAAPSQVVGHFLGGGYCQQGVWRPTSDSVMRSNGQPFGHINAEQWALSVYRDAGVLRGSFPLSAEVMLTSAQSTVFSVAPFAGPAVQRVRWFFNEVELADSLTRGNALIVPPQQKDFVITAIIDDISGLIKQDPEQVSSKSMQWKGTIAAQGE